VNNLDDAPLMLLVHCAENESAQELFGFMQQRYDARLRDAEFGPIYKIGPPFAYCDQTFTKICTFAGSLVIRIVFDTRQSKFERAIIYRLDSEQSLRLLNPGGTESEIDERGLAEQKGR
jgi:hypothetical protein